MTQNTFLRSLIVMAFLGALMAAMILIPEEWFLPRSTLQEIPATSSFSAPENDETGVYPGDVAPDFSLPGMDLEEITLSQHRGHRVLLNFFSTWCEPCRAEMPGVQSQYEKHREHNWVVIGIDIQESYEAVEAFQSEFTLTFPIALDRSGHIAHRYAIVGTPTNISIDPQGVIVDRRLGYMSEDEIEIMMTENP